MALQETIRKAEKEKAYTRRYGLKLNIHTDSDIIECLSNQDSMQGYIKSLIRADIAKHTRTKRLRIVNSWTGRTIAEAETLAEGLREINRLEQADKESGKYRQDMYTLINQDGATVL